MKRKTTKDFLAESFLELAEKRPVSKITITDITDNCEYSQPTFYNHFKDKYDLIAWIARNNAESIISENENAGADPEDVIAGIVKAFIAIVKEKRKVLFNILTHIIRDETLFRQIINVYIDVMWEKLKENEDKNNLTEEKYLVLQTCFYGISMQVAYWLIDDMPYPEETIERAILITIPESLKKTIA